MLDAPANCMETEVREAWLDALTEVVQSQVILATHECMVEYHALTLLDRVCWYRLVHLCAHYDVHVLDEAALMPG